MRTVNSLDDFCLFAPPSPGPGSVIGNTERIEVSWCLQPGHGTRLIPDGAISGAHFVQTPDYVQVTGVGDLTKINIPQGDAGGELDPHGADGNGELQNSGFCSVCYHSAGTCAIVQGGLARVMGSARAPHARGAFGMIRAAVERVCVPAARTGWS